MRVITAVLMLGSLPGLALGQSDRAPPGAPAGPPRAMPAPPAPVRPMPSPYVGDDGVSSIQPVVGGSAPAGPPEPSRSGRDFVTFEVTTRPGRLEPGLCSELVITGLVTEAASFAPDDTMDLALDVLAADLALGEATRRRGADGVIVVAMPITVAAAAEPGTVLEFGATLTYGLHDADGHSSLGRFRDAVEGQLRVFSPSTRRMRVPLAARPEPAAARRSEVEDAPTPVAPPSSKPIAVPRASWRLWSLLAAVGALVAGLAFWRWRS